MSVIEQFGLQMPEDVSFFKNEDALVRLRHAAIYDYRTAPELDDHFIQCSSHLSQNPFVSLVRGIDAGDGEKVLDIGLRHFSGCSVREPNIDRAIYTWEMITDPNHVTAVPAKNITPSLLARAYSCLSYAYFELHQRASVGNAVPHDPTLPSQHLLPTDTPDDDLSNDLLYLAAVYADATAEHGLISPTVLHAASYILRLGTRDGVDLKRSQRYGPLKHLWRAEEARTREWEEEQKKQAVKVARTPNTYICTAPGCGIEGTRKKSLMRCAGKCPMERKPHYCSKECQRGDWKTHKPWCKSDEDLAKECPRPPEPSIDGAPRSLQGVDGSTVIGAEDAPEMPDPGYVGPEHAINIELPGEGMVRLVSRNLTPAVMRWMRDKTAEDRASRGTDNK
ncbi:hypothetical protein C8Q76DRAFT_732493 [Earliella scabrosa]|nr:hypothetical protein C8Q76DRAFT_732493 [Earliella scabrosa]